MHLDAPSLPCWWEQHPSRLQCGEEAERVLDVLKQQGAQVDIDRWHPVLSCDTNMETQGEIQTIFTVIVKGMPEDTRLDQRHPELLSYNDSLGMWEPFESKVLCYCCLPNIFPSVKLSVLEPPLPFFSMGG